MAFLHGLSHEILGYWILFFSVKSWMVSGWFIEATSRAGMSELLLINYGNNMAPGE